MIQIVPVSVAQLDMVWPKVKTYLGKAADYARDFIDEDDAYRLIREGKMHLQVIADDGEIIGASTTEIVEYPKCRTLRGIFISGERFDEWREMYDQAMTAAAKNCGAKFVELTGRKGWARRITDLGWREQYTTMVKEI
jgi:hypothetical protein